MKYRDFYEKQARFLLNKPKLVKAVLWVNYLLTGAICLSYAVLCGYALIYTRPFDGVLAQKVLIPPAAALVLVSVLQILVHRNRPYENGFTPVIVKRKKGRSFPSRHSACAFVIGTVWWYVFPPVGIAVCVAGVLLAYLRFAGGVHYPTDLLAGALLGIGCGLLCLI